MKKIVSILIVFILVICTAGCQNNPSSVTSDTPNNSESSKPNSVEQSNHPGTMRSLSSGNKQGYYLVESSGNGYSNLMYIDYKIRRKIYLCSRPNCGHNDRSCTSYLENDTGTPSSYSVYCTDTDLYLFYTGVSSFFTDAAPPAIYRLDLNGENRKTVYTAESGAQIDGYVAPYTDGACLYFQTKKTTLSSPNENGVMEMGKTANCFTRLYLDSGQADDLMELQNRSVVAAYQDGFLFSETDGVPENITDAEKIDEYLRNQKTRIYFYQPASQKETLLYTTKPGVDLWNSVQHDDRLFFIHGDTIQSLNLKNQTVETVAGGLSDSLAIKNCYDGKLYFEQRDEESRATAYQLDLESKKVTPVGLRSNEPGGEPIFILAEAGDDYLVNHRCDRTRNPKDSIMIDENGVEHSYPDYIVNKRYYALVPKSDYQNSKAEYREITEG